MTKQRSDTTPVAEAATVAEAPKVCVMLTEDWVEGDRVHKAGVELHLTREQAETLIGRGRALPAPGTVRVQAVAACRVGDRLLSRGEVREVESRDTALAHAAGLLVMLPEGHPGWPIDRLPRDPRIPVGHPWYVEDPAPLVEVRPFRAGLLGGYVFTKEQVGRFVPIAEPLAVKAYLQQDSNGKRAVALKAAPEKVFTQRGQDFLSRLQKSRAFYGPTIAY